MALYPLLLLAATISALLHIRAEYYGPRSRIYVFKPLTMLIIILLAWSISSTADSWYRQMIILGLIFSLVGDIFLMLPRDRFIFGLLSFLVGHIFYILAFVHDKPALTESFYLLPFLIYAAVFLYFLLPSVGSMLIPIIIYAVVLALMGLQAFDRWSAFPSLPTMCAAVGAILFIISDSVLALNRFVKPFRLAQATVLSTYFTAQALISLSLLGN